MWGAGWGYWGWGWWWLIAARGRPSSGISAEEQILRERYARGEISRQEYEDRMSDLRRAA